VVIDYSLASPFRRYSELSIEAADGLLARRGERGGWRWQEGARKLEQ